MTQRPARFHIAALALALIWTAAPAYADAAKAAINMSREALTAYDAADYVRAGALYDQAYKTDPRPEFLFGAARAAHLGGDAARADELYRRFIALPDADPALAKKAKGYLADLKAQKAEIQARDAQTAHAHGDAGTAARLWQAAFALNPQRVDWLARSGHALAEAGETTAAEAAYRRYLADAPAQAADRGDVAARLTALEAGKGPVRSHGVAGWSAIALGGAAGIGGLAIFLWANGDASTLQTAYGNRDAAGHIVGLTPQDAHARQTSIDNRETAAVILASVGVAALGVGTWLIVGDRAEVAVVPGLGGASLTVGWR